MSSQILDCTRFPVLNAICRIYFPDILQHGFTGDTSHTKAWSKVVSSSRYDASLFPETFQTYERDELSGQAEGGCIFGVTTPEDVKISSSTRLAFHTFASLGPVWVEHELSSGGRSRLDSSIVRLIPIAAYTDSHSITADGVSYLIDRGFGVGEVYGQFDPTGPVTDFRMSYTILIALKNGRIELCPNVCVSLSGFVPDDRGGVDIRPIATYPWDIRDMPVMMGPNNDFRNLIADLLERGAVVGNQDTLSITHTSNHFGSWLWAHRVALQFCGVPFVSNGGSGRDLGNWAIGGPFNAHYGLDSGLILTEHLNALVTKSSKLYQVPHFDQPKMKVAIERGSDNPDAVMIRMSILKDCETRQAIPEPPVCNMNVLMDIPVGRVSECLRDHGDDFVKAWVSVHFVAQNIWPQGDSLRPELETSEIDCVYRWYTSIATIRAQRSDGSYFDMLLTEMALIGYCEGQPPAFVTEDVTQDMYLRCIKNADLKFGTIRVWSASDLIKAATLAPIACAVCPYVVQDSDSHAEYTNSDMSTRYSYRFASSVPAGECVAWPINKNGEPVIHCQSPRKLIDPRLFQSQSQSEVIEHKTVAESSNSSVRQTFDQWYKLNIQAQCLGLLAIYESRVYSFEFDSSGSMSIRTDTIAFAKRVDQIKDRDERALANSVVAMNLNSQSNAVAIVNNWTFAGVVGIGPKLASLNYLQCAALETMELRFPVDTYQQPFDAVMIRLPADYTLAHRVKSAENSGPVGCILRVCNQSKMLSVIVILESGHTLLRVVHLVGDKDLESCVISNYSKGGISHGDTFVQDGPDIEVVNQIVRLACNTCQLMTISGCDKRGPADPKRAEWLERRKKAKAKPEILLANDRERMSMPEIISFRQNMVLYTEEREKPKSIDLGPCADSEVASGTHASPRPHWRRGHWARVRVGSAGDKRIKLIHRPAVFVNGHLFAGRLVDSHVDIRISGVPHGMPKLEAR